MNPDGTEKLGEAQFEQVREIWRIWEEIVELCRDSNLKGINVASEKRRKAILFINDRINS